MKRLYLQRLGLACVAAAFAVFLFKSYAEDKPVVDKRQRPDAALDQPQVKSVGQYYFPNWVFDDPKGDNALITHLNWRVQISLFIGILITLKSLGLVFRSIVAKRQL